MSASVPSWASFFSREGYDSFVEIVESEMLRRDLDFEMSDGVIQVRLPGGENTRFGLVNLAQLCNQVETEDWTETVRSHFENMLVARSSSAALDEQDFDSIRDKLRVRIYPSDYGDGLDVKMVYRDVAPGLIEALVYDLPTSIATVNPDHIESWGRPVEELFELGVANVKRHEEVDIDMLDLETGARLHTVMGDSFFTASYALFLHDLVDMGERGLLVSVPNRHLAIFHAIENLSVIQAINAMIFIAYRRYQEGPGSVSPDLYWLRVDHRGPRWTLLPTSFDDNGISFSPPDVFVDDVLNQLEDP